MEVNGHVLPQKLADLLQQHRWNTDINNQKLNEVITGSSRFDFLDIDSMRRESDVSHIITNEKIARSYGLESSMLSGKSVDDIEILDVDNMVMIALNWDEEPICLDYRESQENPRVMICSWDDAAGARWRILAQDFDSFLQLVGLPG
jgi:hypothetical protein